jgi:hypothetical protein
MSQLNPQCNHHPPEKLPPGSPDPILDDLLAALEHLLLTRGKVVTALLLEAVQLRVSCIQQRARWQVWL